MARLRLKGFNVHYVSVCNSIKRKYSAKGPLRRAFNGRCYLRSLRMLGNVSCASLSAALAELQSLVSPEDELRRRKEVEDSDNLDKVCAYSDERHP